MLIIKPNYADAPSYCHAFFDLVAENDLIGELQKSKQLTTELILSIPNEMENHAYAANKWTVKEVIRHIIDCERVYAHRAFRFSRFDATELAGFDENIYIQNIKNLDYQLPKLLEEYINVRNATILLFENMTNEMLDFKGIANKVSFTARGLGYMAVGHNLHHCEVISSKYLTDK